MKLGAVFPQTESGVDPVAIRDYAQTVEGLGYTHLLAYDHVLGADTSARPGWSADPIRQRDIRSTKSSCCSATWPA